VERPERKSSSSGRISWTRRLRENVVAIDIFRFKTSRRRDKPRGAAGGTFQETFRIPKRRLQIHNQPIRRLLLITIAEYGFWRHDGLIRRTSWRTPRSVPRPPGRDLPATVRERKLFLRRTVLPLVIAEGFFPGQAPSHREKGPPCGHFPSRTPQAKNGRFSHTYRNQNRECGGRCLIFEQPNNLTHVKVRVTFIAYMLI
jgi:hypothetical protein